MELYTLDSNFQPVRLIENYESLVWSERYSDFGDFQLTSGDIGRTMTLLPLESYVTLRESTVPMVVETARIRNPLRGGPELVVTGRSFDSVIERRQSVITLPSSGTREPWFMEADKQSDAAYKVIRAVIGDVARSKDNVEVLPAIAPQISALDAIPEINLTLPADYSTGLTQKFEIPAQGLERTVLDLINANHHGIKAVRPTVGGTKASIEIYNGADLTSTVMFDARFDQFDDATYLLSHRGSANIAYVYGSGAASVVRKNNEGPELSGLARRVIVVDESGLANDAQVRTSRGLVELYKFNSTALFDGETSVQVASGFNDKYFLGDLVKLVGEYGLSQNVRVAEFIRTSDASGDKSYPAFEAIDE